MDFSFTAEQDAFRREVREFLQRELTPEFLAQLAGSQGDEDSRYSPEFSRTLGRKGWIGLSWPEEYGGQGLGYVERMIYEEEMSLAQAPTSYHHAAERQMGPSIISHGTEEQKRDFLPRIARGEMSIAIGLSERNAGSDLAGLECAAVEDGDDFVVNGHKMWNSAHLAEFLWTSVRTDPEAPKHRGISILLIDLSLSGVAIIPTPLMDGSRKNMVTFDDVRVPRKYMIGEKDQGWYVLASNLDLERSGLESVTGAGLLFEELLDAVKETRFDGEPLAADQSVRRRLARLAMEIQAGRLLCYRNAYLLSAGQIPNVEAAMSKCFNSELTQHIAREGLEILGMHGTLSKGEAYAVMAGRLRQVWLSSFADTYAAGPGEIMRTVIATRGLGLPRGPR